jgi:maltose O-acetyltransferase
MHPVKASDRRMPEGEVAEGSSPWRTMSAPVTIGDEVSLGAGVIVLPGVTVGDRCMVGAGSVVTRDIPADSLAMGTPARVVRFL